ncbi:unnamed protein product, partial [marine sediment metagenome]
AHSTIGFLRLRFQNPRGRGFVFKITSVVVLVDRFLRYARGSVEDCDRG